MKATTASTRARAALGSVVFLCIGPGTIAGLVPWWIDRWQVHAAFPGFVAIRVVGVLLMAGGLAVLVEAFARFAIKGLGTPVPLLPPKRLVVTGTYRYVRNPMYVAAVSLIAGQGLFFGNLSVLAYGFCAWLATYLFVLLYEEPTLRRSFPDDYARFTAHVPRWIPRLTPWNGQG